jgi:gliding motility-associated-like protein
VGLGTLEVMQPPDVIAEFTWSPIPANVNDPTIFFHNASSDALTYSWDFATLGSSTEVSPAFDFPFKFPGTYPVCMIAYNANNCPDTVCHNIVIDDVLQTFVPNAFTPDGNGLNESWGVFYNIEDMEVFELQVFDRWGRVVFQTDDPKVRWDGTFKNGGGEILPEGVYAFRMTYRIDSTKGRREALGHVSLLK